MPVKNILSDTDVPKRDQTYIKIEATFNKLESLTKQLRPLMDSLVEGCEDLSASAQDIDRIDAAYKRFISLLKDEHAKFKDMIQAKELSEDLIRHMRHDLRAQIGAILGYSELIQEDIADCNDDKGIKYNQLLNILIQKTKAIIPAIDEIRIEVDFADIYMDTIPPLDDYVLHEDDVDYDQKYKGLTVLIIDDSAFNREILTRRLTRYGVNILTAENGAVGIETVTHTSVDLILLDIMMPVMNGYDTLKFLKSDSKTKDIPVLMISALSEVESIVRCIEAGAEDYLPTPFNPTVLNARIKACLDKKILRNREQANLEKLEQARQRLATSIESMEDGFAVFGPDGKLVMSNKKFQNLYPGVRNLGYSEFTYEDLLRENYKLGVYFSEKRRSAHHHEDVDNPEDWIKLYASRHTSLMPYLLQLSNGQWIEVSSSRTPDNGMVSVHKDVTERKKDEERLTYLALNDPLTGLANRSSFETRLRNDFSKAHNFSVMFLDLDGFKSVNDQLGHEAGDRLLIQVAEAIKASVRTEDITARSGGDEFAVLLVDETNREELGLIASRILKNVGTDFAYNNKQVNYGVSIGIAVYPDGSATPEEFLSHADTAMYKAKKSGKGHYLFYTDQ